MKLNRISPQSNPFLEPLLNIDPAPAKLYFLGSLPAERTTTVAIVGSRKPTSYGREVTYSLSLELAKRGVIIVSGLALGIDAIAHRAALDAGGKTVAILANGLPQIRPATNQTLGEQIVANGSAIISEYPPNDSVRPYRFLERNRLVSGLADAIVITEAAARSGTLNTAMHALNQSKELFVVPGNINSPMSAGCNRLLSQGANVLTSVDDVLELIAPQLIETKKTPAALNLSPDQKIIIDLLKSGVQNGDQLQRQSQLSATQVAAALTMLEINDLIHPLGANNWSLK